MKKVLIVNTIGMGYEGMSSVIMNYLENMDRSNLDIYIATFSNTSKEYLCRINKVAKAIILPNRKKNIVGYIKGLAQELKKEYDVFHIHGNSGTMMIEVYLAKLYGNAQIITHVHNTTCSHPVINSILKKPMYREANVRLACSIKAGEWLYGKKKFEVLNNAIDLDRYAFNISIRDRMRKELGITDEYVIGHAGSFIEQKNHSFLVDIFFEFQKSIPNSRLLLLSDGPEMQNIRKKLMDYQILDKVIFLGRRSNAYLFYQVMDCFVLPSKWEGLPLVALEAQAADLPVYISDKVTSEVSCSSKAIFLSLDMSPSSWAKKIKNNINESYNRVEGKKAEMVDGKFDIKAEAKKLRKLYIGK